MAKGVHAPTNNEANGWVSGTIWVSFAAASRRVLSFRKNDDVA